MKIKLSLVLLLFFVFSSAQHSVSWISLKKYKIAELSDSIRESSGLIYSKDTLFTINDSGNPSVVFALNPKNGKLIKKYSLQTENKDWEAVSSDDENFYIGDFGNNKGNRKDLSVIRQSRKNDSIFTRIYFQYPEQKTFNNAIHRHNWDAESMFVSNGNVNILTKEWKSYNTTRYSLNVNSGEEKQMAFYREKYHLGFMATDASLYENTLYIVGYTKSLDVYLMVFKENEEGLFFQNKGEKYYLGSFFNIGQIEGLAVNETGLFFSSESFKYSIIQTPASLYYIPKSLLN